MKKPTAIATTRRTAVYLRASVDTTGERQAVLRHEEKCLEKVSEKGWVVAATYTDNSISSKKGVRRPAYEQMMADYAAGRFDAIVCWDLDRLTRVPRELEDMIDACEHGKLALVTASGEADLTTDNGRMFARVKVAIARGEVERKGERQRLAQQQRAKQGRPAKGVRPLGYALDGTIITTEAKIVRRIFKQFEAGDSLKGIAAQLQREGVPTRRPEQLAHYIETLARTLEITEGAAERADLEAKLTKARTELDRDHRWSFSSVSSILRNARYAGRSVYKGTDVGAATWKPIITEAQFNAVQARLEDPRRKTRGDSTARKHLGSGLYFCSCGLRVRSSSSAGGKQKSNRYNCRNMCFFRSAKPIDDYVLAVVRGRLALPDLAELLAKPVDQGRVAELAAERKRLDGLLKRFEADYDAGLIDGRRLKAATTKTEAQLTELRAEEAKLMAHHGPDAILATKDPVAAFDKAPLAVQQQLIDALMTVTLHPGQRGHKVFDPATVVIVWR